MELFAIASACIRAKTPWRAFKYITDDVNEASNGMTPLMVAARFNKVEIITLLISKGARVGDKDEKGFTALKYAELSKANEAISALKSS